MATEQRTGTILLILLTSLIYVDVSQQKFPVKKKLPKNRAPTVTVRVKKFRNFQTANLFFSFENSSAHWKTINDVRTVHV